MLTSEVEQGKRLLEPLIKQITGNDSITARFLYGEYFEFLPTFKIFMGTNYKPTIKGTDHGIWRRIKLIPFLTTISAENRDKHLETKLLAEASGILNWMIEGARRWFNEGLVLPSEVENATDEYRGEMDVFGSFMKECCVMEPDARVWAREIYKVYKEWCDENNEHACSERFVGLRLKELGFEKGRSADARFWRGVKLKEQG